LEEDHTICKIEKSGTDARIVPIQNTAYKGICEEDILTPEIPVNQALFDIVDSKTIGK
jgi:hypothetical protein